MYQLTITKASVMISSRGTDLVFLTTELPSPYPPDLDSAPLTLKFDVTAGKGISYVRENFGIEPKVIYGGAAK